MCQKMNQVCGVLGQNHYRLHDQDIFTNLSGDWNAWEHSSAAFSWCFDTVNYCRNYGASLRLNYSVPPGGFGILWISLLGKVDYDNQYLDFTDLYGDLVNSSGNPTDIENVEITQFNFWIKFNVVLFSKSS